MPLTPSTLLATYLKAFARSVLFSLGLDHTLIEFLANAAAGAATVLLVVFFFALRIPRRRSANSARLNPAGRNPDQEIQHTLIKDQNTACHAHNREIMNPFRCLKRRRFRMRNSRVSVLSPDSY